MYREPNGIAHAGCAGRCAADRLRARKGNGAAPRDRPVRFGIRCLLRGTRRLQCAGRDLVSARSTCGSRPTASGMTIPAHRTAPVSTTRFSPAAWSARRSRGFSSNRRRFASPSCSPSHAVGTRSFRPDGRRRPRRGGSAHTQAANCETMPKPVSTLNGSSAGPCINAGYEGSQLAFDKALILLCRIEYKRNFQPLSIRRGRRGLVSLAGPCRAHLLDKIRFQLQFHLHGRRRRAAVSQPGKNYIAVVDRNGAGTVEFT